MRTVLALLSLPLFALLAACGAAQAGTNDPNSPADVKPAASEVLAMSDDFEFLFMPGATITELEWDIEIDYDTRDVGAVFDFYHDAFIGLGFTQTNIDRGGDDIEAEYSNATSGLDLEIDVERDDNRVEVDLDIDNFSGPFPTDFTLTSFAGLELPIYDADVVDVEWDFNFVHPANDSAEVFAYYDGHLQDLGWTQTELDDGDDDEMEAEYEKDGVHLELEAEGDTEVELEFNKLRFY